MIFNQIINQINFRTCLGVFFKVNTYIYSNKKYTKHIQLIFNLKILLVLKDYNYFNSSYKAQLLSS